MTTLTQTANGAFDLSALSGRELQELFEAIENEIERRQEELEKAKQELAKKSETQIEAEKKVQKIEPLEQFDEPHYYDGRHTSAKIVTHQNIRTEGVDFSDVDTELVDKLAKIYIRDNGNTIPMLIESTGYEDCDLYYNLMDIGKSKTIYLALKKAYEINKKVAPMAIIRQGKSYMMSHEANGKMDEDITSEYELLM